MVTQEQKNQSLTIKQYSTFCDLMAKSNDFTVNTDFIKRMVTEIYSLLAVDQKLSMEDYKICDERFKILENTIQEIRNIYKEDTNDNSCS